MTTPKAPDGSCAHQSCACLETTFEQAGKRYCSPSCAQQEEEGHEQQPCRCGHATCAA